MTTEKIRDIIHKMTLEEKAGLCSGKDFWHTKGIERLGIPETMVSDGPHGLRKQDLEADHLGINESIKAVCFPAGCATAASFNRELLTAMGETLGEECQAEGVSVILGPAVNIKRSPLCGRNFEYFSEDPYLASEIATAHIKGVQSKNVGTSLKHFLANNQETRRMSSSSEIDERTLREIYLAAFEGVVVSGKPWTVMCSYNKINGVYASENKKYLTDILRDEWGFDGYVVSDWGAVNNRVEGLAAGLDLEMPASYELNDALIVKAVQEGRLKEEVLDTAVERILNIVYRYVENKDNTAVFDLEKHHKKAREVAEETAVLLKNEGVLPLKENSKTAFIGVYAKKPRYQGGGSSHINSFKVVSALQAVEGYNNISYAQGYEDNTDEINEELMNEAIIKAKEADSAVIFAGLPDSFESEGYDRKHMRMPKCQNELIHRIAEVQPNTIVVLHNGSPVEMPWINEVKAVLEVYLGGQAVGETTVEILYGKVNPSGRLAETFPLKLEDNPSYLYYFGEKDTVEYREGIFVGYRYYDKKNMKVLFPFGHGLSYTTFEYSNLKLSASNIKDTDTLTVTVDVTNTGSMAGKEVIQLYVGDKESTVIRPVKELKEFAKVDLQPGETTTVTFTLGKRAFAYYNKEIQNWHVESGEFDIMIAKSVENVILKESVFVESTVKLPKKYDENSILGDIFKDPDTYKVMEPYMNRYMQSMEESNKEPEEDSVSTAAISKEMQEAMLKDTPLRGLISFGGGTITWDDIYKLIEELNK